MDVDLNVTIDFTYLEEKIIVEDGAKFIGKSSPIDVEDHMNTSDPIKKEIEKKLVVGSIVDGLDQVFLLYCEYARCTGFSVRKGKHKYFSKSLEVRWKEFKCSCEGQSSSKADMRILHEYKKQVRRTECKAMLRVGRERDGPWKVSIFVNVHNHELVHPSQSYLLRSARQMTHAKMAILEAMHSAGIGVSRACTFMEIESGGTQNVGFSRRDAYNHIKSLKWQTKIEDADANALVQFFVKKSNDEANFFWNVDLDDNGKLMNFFFRDSRCAVDYEEFCDVLSIDTTYRTNKYNLICAPFVGINHHRNNVMLGLAFLSNETTSTFEWLFKTFLDSMKGKEPKVVFSDQCRAMMNAIDSIFPNVHHRLCQWHIDQNAPSHFGALNGDNAFKKLWHQCMNRCDTEAEFEELWKRMIKSYDLKEHTWFSSMYELRKRWASVFTNNIFTAGLLATSRSEGTNRTLKDLCRSSCSLYDFVQKYENIISTWRSEESGEDVDNIYMPGQLVNGNILVNHAARVYTRSIFKIFQHEAAYSTNVEFYDPIPDLTMDNIEFVVKSCWMNSGRRVVNLNKTSHDVSCTCAKWETEGVFCRHIIHVYYFMRVKAVPQVYILKRWSKTARSRISAIVDSFDVDVEQGRLASMTFVKQIIRNVYDITHQVEDCSDAKELIRRRLDDLKQEIATMLKDKPSEKVKVVSANESGIQFRDPKPAKTKGSRNAKLVTHWDASNPKGKKRAKRSKATEFKSPPTNARLPKMIFWRTMILDFYTRYVLLQFKLMIGFIAEVYDETRPSYSNVVFM